LAKAKAKKKAVVEKKTGVPAGVVLDQTEPVPPVEKISKKDMAQQCLDQLGSATPSVDSNGMTIRWVPEAVYNRVNDLLGEIVTG